MLADNIVGRVELRGRCEREMNEVAIKVTVRPGYRPPPPPAEPEVVVVEMSREDAEALVTVAYGVSGPHADDDYGVSLTVRPYKSYPRPACDLRDRLRGIGNAINLKLGVKI